MSFGAPDPPNAGDVSNYQFGYNRQAATAQNKINSYNQSTPFGALNYVEDASSPSGYRVQTSLSPEQQQLLDTRIGTQNTLGTTAGDLAKNSASMYSSPFDLNSASGATADLLNSWQKRYLDPLYQMQDSNLEARLQNQGLTPGSEAYNNAKNLLSRNQADTTTSYLTKNQGQAFNQALQQYQLPAQMLAGMFGASAPQGPAFQATPTATVQPPNYAQAAQNQFQGEYQNYQNMIGDIGKIANIGVSMFGGGWG